MEKSTPLVTQESNAVGENSAFSFLHPTMQQLTTITNAAVDLHLLG